MRYMIGAAALAALAGCSETPPDPRGVARNEVLLQVSATGSADTRPDEARFTAGIETFGATAAEASTENNRTMARITAALERFGVKEDDLQTRQVSLSRVEYGPRRGRFQANNAIEVRVREVARAGEAIAAATQAGANNVSGPDFRVTDAEAASRAAYAAAYRAARARADAYAEAAGLRVARVLVIRDTEEQGPQPYYHGMDAAMQVSAPPPEEAAPVRVGVNTSRVRVRADFALAE